MKESYVFLAEGFEEIEALTVVDVMRRAGMPVKTVSITSCLGVVGAHGIPVKADVIFSSSLFTDPGWLVLPGGLPGATNLYEHAQLQGLLESQEAEPGAKIAAICASPAVVLGQLGLLQGKRATCYPGCESMMHGATVVDERVVVDGDIVTGNGPSSALPWALTIVSEACGEETANKVANAMLLYPNHDEGENFFG